MVKRNKSKREISNRLLYTLITIGILAIIGVGVYAYGTSNPSYFGHSAGELSGVCLTNGTGCPGSGSSSQWTTSGNNIYYNNGSVGIGTSTPSSKLSVSGNLNVSGNLSASTNIIVGVNSTAQPNVRLLIEGSNPGLLGSTVYIQANNPNNGAALYAVNGYGGNVGNGVYGWGSIGVQGYSSSSTGIGVEGFSTHNGVVGIGNDNDFYANGVGVNYGSPSSIRWKKNIVPIKNALDIVLNLRGVSFDWDSAHGGKHDIGFIGEQVGQYIPEIVNFDTNSSNPNYYVTGMDYGAITPVLLEAIKEQQKQIEALKLEVEQLKNK